MAFRVPRMYGILRKTNNTVRSDIAVGSQPGKSRHKSFVILYFKRGPKFKEKTTQQKAIALIGKYCAAKMEGKGVKERKLAAKKCAEEFKGLSPSEIISRLSGKV